MEKQTVCETIEVCPIFAQFRAFQKHMYIEMYCTRHYRLCARRKLRLAGKPVPADLAPNGLSILPVVPER